MKGNLSPVEVSPLLTRHSSVSTMGERDLSNGEHVRQQRGLARAIMLWLGIGQWYCKSLQASQLKTALHLVCVCVCVCFLQLVSAYSSVFSSFLEVLW